ncbi:MAG: hypothetical protein ACI9D5_001724 [Candidatus Endobugula sp.]|jgi:hypothetical protein
MAVEIQMDWRFIDSNTLEEHKTGYIIRLLGGTWFHPKEIKPEAPAGMVFLQQAQLLRCGLEYVTELCHGQKEKAEAV